MSQVRPKADRVGEIAARAVVQLLFATGKSFTVDGLREKLREFFRQEARPELRAVAALNNVELITALISFNRQLGLVGLQLRILNGVVSLLTSRLDEAVSIVGRNGVPVDLTTRLFCGVTGSSRRVREGRWRRASTFLSTARTLRLHSIKCANFLYAIETG
jgi:hypothetical protein